MSTFSFPVPQPMQLIDRVIDQALADQRLVGAVVLVARDGELVYQRAAGSADREAGRMMQADALFRLASVSKPIVSVAALVLVAQGRLALDAGIERWLPDFRPCLPDGGVASLTVRQLLSHTAGLGYRFFEADENGPYARAGVSDGMNQSAFSLAENLRRLASVPLLYPPGSNWGYSLATDVLGAVIEQVCGQPLAKAVRELVTGPLGMDDTGFVARDASRLAAAYVNDAPSPRRMRELDIVPAFEGTVGIRYAPARALDETAFASGGAGMVGSAGDVLRLLEVLRQGGAPLLPAALVQEMGRDQTGGRELPNAPGFGFGLGFSVLRDPAAAASPESPGTWRWGGAYGHAWFVDGARGLSVVALTNTLYEGMSGRFVADVRDAVYGIDRLEPRA
ncbi:serine hydrolase domain-containing protein [Janthinobacterium aquaticum]|uniref:serine hydrolase domain-containing protein n=1 Tax=Janthinobacterium sp. FT58W TaxID=2654254 RepID=UPI0012642A83|nr:serine hydrolase domain-containing protein [Janthinobacterium sp. FT58W]KAB8038581.1 serine hydrolase [Janthinobacterium sp. FT58W]